MYKSAEFRASLVSVAEAVMHCEYCCEHAPPHDRPWPSWVGRDYVPNQGVVFVLQNPAVRPPNYELARELELLDRLLDFSASPSPATYAWLMQWAFMDMTGVVFPAWPLWTHPIGKLFDRLDRAPEDLRAVRGCAKLAWMNVVKYRTSDNDPVSPDAILHGIDVHLRRELEVLRPKAIVSVGDEAKWALRAMGIPSTGHLKMRGASNKEVKALQILLHEYGVHF